MSDNKVGAGDTFVVARDTSGIAGDTGRARATGARRRTDRGRAVSLSVDPAVAEARAMAERLQAMLHRGLGDNLKRVRSEASRLSGVPESYFNRLRHRAHQMTDVSGKYARLLRIACEALEARTERANRQREDATHALLELRRAVAEGRSEGFGGDREAASFARADRGEPDRPAA